MERMAAGGLLTVRPPTLVLLVLQLSAVCNALHPRPVYSQYASFARWLVHESDYVVVSTRHAGTEVFGNVASISDGEGSEDSTGVIYTFLPDLDATFQDLQVDSRVAVTLTEMALAGGNSGGCSNSTAENPPCARLTISGRLTEVPAEHTAEALRFLYARHPEMRDWAKQHHFKPFWLAKENITGFFLINMFGGPAHFTAAEYFSAPWYRNDTSSGLVCSTCGHVYDAARDGAGKPFDKLSDDWRCPICGSPKSSYHQWKSPTGDAVWVHV